MIAAAEPRLHYTLSMPRPSSHIFEVSIDVAGLPSGSHSFDLVMPVWRPGRYLVLDFAGGVLLFDARTAQGAPLEWTRPDIHGHEVNYNDTPVSRAKMGSILSHDLPP